MSFLDDERAAVDRVRRAVDHGEAPASADLRTVLAVVARMDDLLKMAVDVDKQRDQSDARARRAEEALRLARHDSDTIRELVRGCLHGGCSRTREIAEELVHLAGYEPHDGECEMVNARCVRCGRWATGADFLAAVDALQECADAPPCAQCGAPVTSPECVHCTRAFAELPD